MFIDRVARLFEHRQSYADFMGRVSGLLMSRHGISSSDIRPTRMWARMWRKNYTPEAAAYELAQKLRTRLDNL